MATLREKTEQVVADKKLVKALVSYVEEKRDILAVTIFDGKAEFNTSPGIDNKHIICLLSPWQTDFQMKF